MRKYESVRWPVRDALLTMTEAIAEKGDRPVALRVEAFIPADPAMTGLTRIVRHVEVWAP